MINNRVTKSSVNSDDCDLDSLLREVPTQASEDRDDAILRATFTNGEKNTEVLDDISEDEEIILQSLKNIMPRGYALPQNQCDKEVVEFIHELTGIPNYRLSMNSTLVELGVDPDQYPRVKEKLSCQGIEVSGKSTLQCLSDSRSDKINSIINECFGLLTSALSATIGANAKDIVNNKRFDEDIVKSKDLNSVFYIYEDLRSIRDIYNWFVTPKVYEVVYDEYVNRGVYKKRHLRKQKFIYDHMLSCFRSYDVTGVSKKVYRFFSEKKAVLEANIGIIELVFSNFDDAVKRFKKSSDLYLLLVQKTREEKYVENVAKQICNLATSLETMGEIDRALNKYLECLKLYENLGMDRNQADQYGNLGVVYETMGDFSEALRCFNQALKIYERLDDERGVAMQLGNIGVIHAMMDNLNESEECYRRSLSISQNMGCDKGESIQLHNLGNIFMQKNDFEEAIEYFDRALRIAEGIPSKEGISIIQSSKGDAYMELKEYGKAEGCYIESLNHLKGIGNTESKKEILPRLAEIYRVNGFKTANGNILKEVKDFINDKDRPRRERAIGGNNSPQGEDAPTRNRRNRRESKHGQGVDSGRFSKKLAAC